MTTEKQTHLAPILDRKSYKLTRNRKIEKLLRSMIDRDSVLFPDRTMARTMLERLKKGRGMNIGEIRMGILEAETLRELIQEKKGRFSEFFPIFDEILREFRHFEFLKAHENDGGRFDENHEKETETPSAQERLESLISAGRNRKFFAEPSHEERNNPELKKLRHLYEKRNLQRLERNRAFFRASKLAMLDILIEAKRRGIRLLPQNSLLKDFLPKFVSEVFQEVTMDIIARPGPSEVHESGDTVVKMMQVIAKSAGHRTKNEAFIFELMDRAAREIFHFDEKSRTTLTNGGSAGMETAVEGFASRNDRTVQGPCL